MLIVENASGGYTGEEVVKDISFSVEKESSLVSLVQTEAGKLRYLK